MRPPPSSRIRRGRVRRLPTAGGTVTRRLQALTVVLFLLCALGLSVSVVGDVRSGRVAWVTPDAPSTEVVALLAVAVSALAAGAVTVTVLRSTLSRTGVRSRGSALWALAAVAYLPALLLGPGWLAWSAVAACFVLELLPPRPAVALASTGLLLQVALTRAAGETWGASVFAGVSYLATSVLLFVVLRCVGTYRELELARAELAHAEVLAERVRVSRDLHDLLGRNLAAISLKVELARRHQRGGRGEALAGELDDVLGLSHAAAADLRALVAGYRVLTVRTELAAAVRLLTDAGVRCEVDADLDGEGAVDGGLGAADDVVAWVLREAATNVVKHAGATWCTVSVHAGGAVDGNAGVVDLVVENDGVAATEDGGTGTGLVGARERVRVLGGALEVAVHRDVFRLTCRVPVRGVAPASGVRPEGEGRS
ncbi:histidine kinase [Kineococcus endophyticus]|uniref:Histidine kinase n=1 Tax=Kineococcus endophyticus TaxID=1181883 RepID=A0ABV3P757_9ACTN